MEDGKNANPLILNPSDLPTRKRRTSALNDKPNSSLFSYPSPSYANNSLFRSASDSASVSDIDSDSDADVEPIDEQEIYDLVATMSDPEHPITLGSLAVVSLPDISIQPTIRSRPDSPLRTVTVLITPTIQHCSLATVIGLGVRVRLEESLPPRFRVDVRIKEGTHSTADEVNKQLADKERVAAALWNPTLQSFIKKMLETCEWSIWALHSILMMYDNYYRILRWINSRQNISRDGEVQRRPPEERSIISMSNSSSFHTLIITICHQRSSISWE